MAKLPEEIKVLFNLFRIKKAYVYKEVKRLSQLNSCSKQICHDCGMCDHTNKAMTPWCTPQRS